MSKQEATNVFNEGLVMDLNPLTTPNNVLTNALNATLITYNGNEFILQNDMGNGRVETATLPSGFIPLGVKEYGGIIYVASYNPNSQEGQLGSFPSPERNLTQDEIGGTNLSISRSDFIEGNNIKYYYKRIDVMPNDMYLNPGDKFGLFITGTGYNILSYYQDNKPRILTFHPAILDDLGMITYIDEDCKINGKYQRGLIIGQSTGDLSDLDTYREAFNKLLVYKGKKSGKLILIAELETLEDFVVSRSISSNKTITKEIGSSEVAYSDDNGGEDSSFKVTFYNSGWAKQGNDYIHFTGIKFESNLDNFDLIANGNPINYTIGNYSRDTILKYTITPYTELGLCTALARTGIINFALFGTGNIILTEWRYYVENNKLRLNYGFDINLLEGESVKSIVFNFYDVYYNKIYDNSYTCGSTISGTYNGNYTETFNLPYDLNYTDTYQEGVSNKDYIYNEIIQGNRLKRNELLKNNLYCVQITVTTTGLDNGDQTKTFYRFMYTTGYFNRAYIENDESNFSLLRVPDDYLPTYSIYCDTDTTSDLNYKLDYINDPLLNGDKHPYRLHSSNPSEVEPIETNMYQDWNLQNATITLKTQIDVKDNNMSFGDYKEGWFALNITNQELVIEYDNSNESMTTVGVIDSDRENYVSLINTSQSGDLADQNDVLRTYEEALQEVNFVTAPTYQQLWTGEYDTVLRDKYLKDNNSEAYNNDLEALRKINDMQFYEESDSVGDNIEIPEQEEGSDPVIKLSNIKGRLIRRLSGTTTTAFKSMTLNELRPCVYRYMDINELQNLIAGCSGNTSSDEIINYNGKVMAFGGDDDGKSDLYVHWLTGDSFAIHGSDNPIWHMANPDNTDKGNALPYRDIIDGLVDRMGGQKAIVLMQHAVYQNVYEDDVNKIGYVSISYNTKASGSGYLQGTKWHSTFDASRHTVYVNKTKWAEKDAGSSQMTMIGWRTDKSTDVEADYGVINISSLNGYQGIAQDILIPMLKQMYLLHNNVTRDLYVETLSNMVYHDQFATTIKLGVKFNYDSDNTSDITINRSPVLLYNDRPFESEAIRQELLGLGWNIDEDTWYASIEDTTEGAIYKQCTCNNIPYNAYAEGNTLNEANRSENIANIDTSKLTITSDGSLLLGLTLSLGGQINMATVAQNFNAEISNLSTSKPTLIYEPGETEGDYSLTEGTDITGAEFTNRHVYFKKGEDYISGDSESAKNVKLFDNGGKSVYGMFGVNILNGFAVPVLNSSNAAGSHSSRQVTINLDKKDHLHYTTGIIYYQETNFGDTNSTPYSTTW